MEGTCYAANNFITANGALALCGGQPLTVSAPAAQSYLWSTGDTTQRITVSKDGASVGGTSIMGLMMLAASPGCCITVEATGPDAEAALDALEQLVADKFGEEC